MRKSAFLATARAVSLRALAAYATSILKWRFAAAVKKEKIMVLHGARPPKFLKRLLALEA